MANALSGFDPAGAFQEKRRGALDIRAREQALDESARQAPIRNELSKFKLAQAKTGAQRQTTQFDQGQALQRAKITNNVQRALLGIDPANRRSAVESLGPQMQGFGIDLTNLSDENLSDQGLTQGITATQALITDPNKLTEAEKSFTLKEGETRFSPAGKEIASVSAEGAGAQIPQELLEGLDTKIATKGEAAFRAAGGGKDGLKAFNKAVDIGNEAQRRATTPKILAANFPTASPAELNQLQATMDAAKTAESGLKSAEKVRKEQKRLKKAKTFQEKALSLIDRILSDDQLGDVLGSVEGAIDFRLFSDAEAGLIADIKEAENILTGENLDLMTGVLSETDIKILTNIAGGALNRKREESVFKKDLEAVRDGLLKKAVTTVNDQAAASPDIAAKRARLAELRAKAGR